MKGLPIMLCFQLYYKNFGSLGPSVVQSFTYWFCSPTAKEKEIKFWRMSNYVSPPMTIPQLTRSSFCETPFKEVILRREAPSLGYCTGKRCSLLTLLWLLVSVTKSKRWLLDDLESESKQSNYWVGRQSRGDCSRKFPNCRSPRALVPFPQASSLNTFWVQLSCSLKRTNWGRSASPYYTKNITNCFFLDS